MSANSITATSLVSSTPTAPVRDRLSVSMHFVNECLARAAGVEGVDTDELLRKSGISRRLVEPGSRARVSVEQFARLYLNTSKVLKDEALLALDRQVVPGTFAFGCQTMLQCQTVGDALERMVFFYNLLGTGIESRFVRSDGQARLEWHRKAGRPPVYNGFYEVSLLATHRTINWLIARHIPLTEARFPYPAPPHADEYRSLFFAHPVVFDADCAALVFPEVFCGEPLRQDERTLVDYIRRAPLSFLRQNYEKAGYSSRVRTMIRTRVHEFPSFEDVAAHMGLHPRTLWRRLKKEGVTYRDIKNQLRRDIAIYHLGQKRLSVESIAFECGFSESSTFIRAFREWTGVTPNDYRKRI